MAGGAEHGFITPRGLVAAGTSTIVAAVANQKIYVFAIKIAVDQAAGNPAFEVARIRSGDQTKSFMSMDGANSPKTENHNAGGAATNAGDRLELLNNDNTAHDFNVNVAYTQA